MRVDFCVRVYTTAEQEHTHVRPPGFVEILSENYNIINAFEPSDPHFLALSSL